jgi:hypothetical protein
MTLSTITPSIREWFSLKGITNDQDMQLFGDLGGSISRGAFLLLCTLSRFRQLKPDHPRSPLLEETVRKRKARAFDRDTLDKCEALYARLTRSGSLPGEIVETSAAVPPPTTDVSNVREEAERDAITSEELEKLPRRPRITGILLRM